MSAAVNDRQSDAGDVDVDDRETRRLAPAPGALLRAETARVGLAGALVVALVAALVTCGVLAWQHGDHEPSPLGLRADARDEARSAAVRDVEALMTADHHDAAGTFRRWSGVTTGRLHTRLAGQKKTILKRLVATREVTTVRTIEAALSSWDEAAGTARLLAVLELRTTSKDKPSKPFTRTVRYLAMTQRVEGKWLLAAIQPIGAAA